MSLINLRTGEIAVKIVYFGPALAGMSTNIRTVHRKTRPALRGRLEEIDGIEPMLAFDFAPDTLPLIAGRFRLRLHLVTVPGPVLGSGSLRDHPNLNPRRLVLSGVDAVVFVADTQEEGGELVRFDDNVESMNMLLSLLDDLGVDSAVMPLVIQYNKRDLVDPAPPLPRDADGPIALSNLAALDEVINPNGLPTIEAVATQGFGVLDTLRTLVRNLLEPLRQEYEGSGSQYPIAGASGSFPRP